MPKGSTDLLPLPLPERNASTVYEACTKPLRDLLLDATDAKEAVRRVSRNPGYLDEIKDIAPLVARLGGPVGKDGVYVALQPLLILFGAPDLGHEALLDTWVEIYQNALEKLPKEALEFAVSEYIRVGKAFFPKPSDLNRLAEAKATQIRTLTWRVRQCADAVPPPAAREKTAEEKAEVARMLAEFRAKPMPPPKVNGTYESQSHMAERLRANA